MILMRNNFNIPFIFTQNYITYFIKKINHFWKKIQNKNGGLVVKSNATDK